jgi:periplasmic glucans biosynthesis protein
MRAVRHELGGRGADPRLSRRSLLTGAAGAVLASIASAPGGVEAARSPFGFPDVTRRAAALTRLAFSPETPPVPPGVQAWTYEDYRRVQFESAHVLWRGENLRFEIDFLPRGAIYRDLVRMNLVDREGVRPLAFAPSMFRGWPSGSSIETLASLGFAGLRVRFPLANRIPHECAAFLGASYFRAVGKGQLYGVSARCLAVDAATDRLEEFPAFREFWLVRPDPEAEEMTLLALLDGPSLAGAFEFRIRPGLVTRVRVVAEIFARRTIRKLGLAPLSSMFLYGEARTRTFDDFRPEVHDSDGLLFATGGGEWLWRPLDNPARLRVSRFSDRAPKGFGLLQRDRQFDHYQDLEALYHRRTSAWVTPGSHWEPGALELLEFPSDVEYHDNVALMWVMDRPVAPGQSRRWEYELRFGGDEVDLSPQGRVVSSRMGRDRTTGARRFVVEFEGGSLLSLREDHVNAVVSGSTATVTQPVVQPTPAGGWRAAFEVAPMSVPVELRCFLRSGSDVITETWSYQWVV